MPNYSKDISNSIDIVYNETYDKIDMKSHFHNSYEIIVIVEGTAEFKINNKIYQAGKNSMFFINHLESHELAVKSFPYKRFFILIRPEYFQSVINEPVLVSIFKHRPDHFSHLIDFSRNTESGAFNIIKEMYDEASKKDVFWEMSLGAYLQKLFVLLYRDFKEYFPLTVLNNSANTILQIQKYIEENYIDQINLKEISKLFYTDMYYLSHLFKKTTGFTFKEYLILQRLSKAKEQLYYTNNDITQVGLDSGFGNVNHFIKIFKKFEGITPFQYRKRYR